MNTKSGQSGSDIGAITKVLNTYHGKPGGKRRDVSLSHKRHLKKFKPYYEMVKS
jgi:hypothetical protein